MIINMDTTLQQNLVDNIHRYLQKSGTTQQQLAIKTGLHFSTLSRILNGHNVPTLENCERLARVLRISPPKEIFQKKLAYKRFEPCQ